MSNRVTLWCCKGLLQGPDRNEFYEVLGVSRNAETSAIKQAYRRKCLEVHPDKLRQRGMEVTDKERAQFLLIQKAGEVLADPQKRELYDQLGETGMRMIEEPSNINPDKLMQNFLHMKNRERLKLIMFVILFFGIILIFPILICAKIDGDLGSSKWTAIWTPFWIYDGVRLYFLGYMVSLGKIHPPEGMEEGWHDPSPLPLRIIAFLSFCVNITQQVFLTLKLDGNISWDWAYVLLPLLFYCGLNFYSSLIDSLKPLPKISEEHDMEEGQAASYIARETAKAIRKAARDSLLYNTAQLGTLIMIVLKLDEVVNWSWWAVFWPVYAYLGINYIILINQINNFKAEERRLQAEHSDDQPNEQEEEVKQHLMQAQFGLGISTMILVMAFLIIAKVNGASYSMFILLIPAFIISSCIICCMSCLICCFRGDIEELNSKEGENADSAGYQIPPDAVPAEEPVILVPPTSNEVYEAPPQPSIAKPAERRSKMTTIDSDID